jgi:hypothetical protein
MKVCKLLVVGVLLAAVSQGFATEGGGGAYPNGAEDFMVGALPPPGHYFVNYALYYGADKLKDGNGDSVPVDFDLDVYADVLRFVNVTDKKILGGSWAQHIFVPVMSVDVSTPFGNDDTFGIGDIIVDPFIIGWHRANFHWVIGLDTYIPLGKYDKDDIANIGRNYWTFEPVAAATFRNKSGYEASIKAMYDINLENDDTDYDSGDEFHFDYTVGKHIGDWSLGLGGFYYKQITGDDGMMMTPGGLVDAGDNKGEQFAWGPVVAYQHKGMSFVLKYQDEIETENKTEGERIWLKFITRF